MAISNLLTGRVRVVSPKNVTPDRYQFIDLSQVEPNLGVPNFSASLSGSPAIVVSDDQGNRGFVRSLDLDRVTGQFTGSFTGSATSLSGSFTGSFTGSFSGSFSGDGSGLTNLPLSNTAERLASSSFTASFSPTSLNINTNVSVGGNLYVSKSIYADQLVVNIISSSIIYSSGSNIFGNDDSDIQQFTGSVRVQSEFIGNNVTGSSFSGSFTGSFFGDGRNIFNLPEATRISSGSITASVTPEFGFKVESVDSGSQFTGSVSITGSLFVSPYSGSIVLDSGSSYYGEGTYLRNIPLSALNIDSLIASKIASGSVTASVSPNFGLKVESLASGSQFTGSLFVSGAVIAIYSGSFSGSGDKLFNIPRSALAPDALLSPLIASGSVTASVAPNFGFVVTSAQSGSEFTGSVDISGSLFVSGTLSTSQSVYVNSYSGALYIASSSVLYADGQYLRNIPRSALTEDALISAEIKSGSVTASVSPDFGFRVQTPFTSSAFGSQFTGSVDVSGSVRAFAFIGDGSQITNVQAQAAPRIASGSVTASVSPVFGFKVEALASGSEFTGSVDVSGSIFIPSGSGLFSGSGRGLFDIPRSALAPDALLSTFIASGSVTASVSPDEGFVVTSVNSGSKFSGSVFIDSASFLYADGTYLRNVPLSALATDALKVTLMATGSDSASVSASVSLEQGFIVFSPNSGSQFTGSLFVSGNIEIFTGSFSGSGKLLREIPIDAIPDLDLSKIGSGSVTASIRPNEGFRVNTFSTFTGSMLISASATYLPSESIQTVFNVTNSGASAYVFTGAANGQNPTITLVRGITYTFNVNASGHPFWIKTAQTSGTSNAYNTGVTNNGDDVGIITFTPDVSAPNTLYYICQFHGIMAGTINIVDAILQRGPDVTISGSLFVSDRIVAREVTASISASFIQGDGGGLFNIPRSAFTGDSFRISSGSVTASVSPVYGFRVESAEKGSEITGSVFVSGSVTAQSVTAVSMSAFDISGSFVGDGSRLTNIFDVSKSEIAATGISNNCLPLPLNEPVLKNTEPLRNREPVN